MTKPKALEVQRLTRRLRTGGATRSTGPPVDEDEDDLLKTPLDSKLDKILRATQKRNRDDGGRAGVEASVGRGATTTAKKRKKMTPAAKVTPGPSHRLVPSTPKRPRKQSAVKGWTKAAGRGALKGVAKRWGISVKDDERRSGAKSSSPQKRKKVTPRAVKALRPAPGWEDFTEGHKTRRILLPKYDDSDTTASYDYDKEDDEDESNAWIPSFSASKNERTI